MTVCGPAAFLALDSGKVIAFRSQHLPDRSSYKEGGAYRVEKCRVGIDNKMSVTHGIKQHRSQQHDRSNDNGMSM
jgi:hypothetical protein